MSRSILAPLTSTFTPPPACSTYGASGDLSSTEIYWQGQSCSGGFPQDAASCWPPALVTTPSPPLQGWGFYSPGLHCPVGYSSACTAAMLKDGSSSSLQLGTSFKFQFPLTAGETAIGCCPIGLTCQLQGGTQTCATAITTGLVPEVVGFCDPSATSFYTGQSINVGIAYTPDGRNQTTITLATASLFAPLIQINFKSTDIPSLASPTSISTTNDPQAAATSGVYVPVDSNNDNSGGGLSTGAKIGIGVGIPLGVILIAAIAAFFFFRRRRAAREPLTSSGFINNAAEKSTETRQHSNQQPQLQQQQQQQPQQPYQQYGAGEVNKWHHVAEAPNTERSIHRGIELDATPNQNPVELPTSNR